MSKALLALAAVAALLYAIMLALAGRPAPDATRARGFRRRFYLATALFLVFLTGCERQDPKGDPQTTCYAMPVDSNAPVEHGSSFAATARQVWQALSVDRREEFQRLTANAVEREQMRRGVADVLNEAYVTLAQHIRATGRKSAADEPNPRISCYDMTAEMAVTVDSAEKMLKQIVELRRLREKGTIDEATAARAYETLARELTAIQRVKGMNWQEVQAFRQKLEDGKTPIGDTAASAAAQVLELEAVAVPEAHSPGARLERMKTQVEALLLRGPVRDDWKDPSVRPNVHAVLVAHGLLPNAPRVTCYRRAAAPVAARSEELKQLQQRLLDEQVKAGVLDVETAARADAAANPAPEYADDTDISAYQQKVRRAVRLLYKQGEVPPSFVKELEPAIDADIIAFDDSTALRAEVRWRLRSILYKDWGDQALQELARRRLVPPQRNHRKIMQWYARAPMAPATDAVARKVDALKALLDADDPIVLPQDEGHGVVRKQQVPLPDREYRLQIRRAVRAILKVGIIAHASELNIVEEALGVKILGRLAD